jgi:hypothetical protein
MHPVLIDTNVPIVANGGASHASPACRERASARLRQVITQEKVVLDSAWVILKEYQNNLQKGPQPAGSEFYLWVLNNRANPARCEFIDLAIEADTGQYAAFPHADPAFAKFNQSDRVFVAAHLTHPEFPPIVNAVDSDWQEYKAPLDNHGVVVEELCP